MLCTGMITNPSNVLQSSNIWYDTTSDPPSVVNLNIILNEAINAAQNFNNIDAASNENILYVIATPAGVGMSGFGSTFCSFHSSATTVYGNIAFAFVPYTAGMTSCGANYNSLGSNAGVTINAATSYLGWLTDPFPGFGNTPTGKILMAIIYQTLLIVIYICKAGMILNTEKSEINVLGFKQDIKEQFQLLH